MGTHASIRSSHALIHDLWWSQAGSNRRPLACHASALPAELWPHARPAHATQTSRPCQDDPSGECPRARASTQHLPSTTSMRASAAFAARSASVASIGGRDRGAGHRDTQRLRDLAEPDLRARREVVQQSVNAQWRSTAAARTAAHALRPACGNASPPRCLAAALGSMSIRSTKKKRLFCAISFRVLARSRCATITPSSSV